MSEQLTEEQIANWRKVLCLIFGPYALIMPASDIQRYRDRMQAGLDGTRARRTGVVESEAGR